MTSCAACRGGLHCVDLLAVSSPRLGWSPGISCWFTPFHAWHAAGPMLALLGAASHQLQKLQLLSSVKLPGIDEGLVRDLYLAQIIGLIWNLLPISFRLANTNTSSLILHKHNRPQCHMELIMAPSHCWSILICVCTWRVVRHDNLLQQLVKLRQMIYSN